MKIRRHKTTIFLDVKRDATVADVKSLLAGILKRPPEDQRLVYGLDILEDGDEVSRYFQHEAYNPAPVLLSLRDERSGDFEEESIIPYSEPPTLPTALERSDDSL